MLLQGWGKEKGERPEKDLGPKSKGYHQSRIQKGLRGEEKGEKEMISPELKIGKKSRKNEANALSLGKSGGNK